MNIFGFFADQMIGIGIQFLLNSNKARPNGWRYIVYANMN
jgi:hypothetical protein